MSSPILFHVLKQVLIVTHSLGLHRQFEKHWSRCEVGNEHLGTKACWQPVGHSEVGQKSNEYVLCMPRANLSRNLTIFCACLQVSSQKRSPSERSFQISLIPFQAPQAILNVSHSWGVCRQCLTYRHAHQHQPGVPTKDAAWLVSFQTRHGVRNLVPQLWTSESLPLADAGSVWREGGVSLILSTTPSCIPPKIAVLLGIFWIH